MKRYILTLLVLSLPLWLDSCKKENEPAASTTTSIQGNWKITGVKVDPAYQGVTDVGVALALLGETCLNDLTLSFKTDGTISYDQPTSCRTATTTQLLLQMLFAGAKYTETNTTVTIVDATNTSTVATKTSSGNTVELKAQRDLNPAGVAQKTTYTILLTKK